MYYSIHFDLVSLFCFDWDVQLAGSFLPNQRWIWAPAVKAPRPNRWAAREVRSSVVVNTPAWLCKSPPYLRDPLHLSKRKPLPLHSGSSPASSQPLEPHGLALWAWLLLGTSYEWDSAICPVGFGRSHLASCARCSSSCGTRWNNIQLCVHITLC